MNEAPQETINLFDEAFERIKQATGMRTQVEIAKLLDIRQSSISDAKRRQSIPDSWLIKLYQIYNLNPNWVIEGEQPQFLGEKRGGALQVREPGEAYGRRPKYYQMPVAIMSPTQPEQESPAEAPSETLTVPEQFHKPSLVIVRMDENDMEPVIRRGAYVGIDKERRTIRSGGLYALDMPMEGLVIKRVLHDAENSRLILRSENQTYEDQSIPADGAAERVIGRVAWVFQEV
jgi:hypothetical protein